MNIPARRITSAIAVAMAISAASVQAGEIVSDAPSGDALLDVTSDQNKQFGFGGWNLDNVEVNLYNTVDSSPTGGSFDKSTGAYSQMFLLQSFRSSLSVDGEVRGYLNGKSWPIGEPAGVKVVNGDRQTNQGKPQNCIMTTSYLESGYLDAGNKPTLCSSDFQSHKRFKIEMLPSMVASTASGEGSPVEMTFNLRDGDTSTQRYQVFQKLNNYTGKRLDGYKIEVVDALGLPNSSVTLSLGIGESPNEDGTLGDIWDNVSRANFSHGLWGPVDTHFEESGFFDDERTYLAPTLNAENSVISYQGPVLGGNYQELFGEWLPADWEPVGIFHDDDMDPSTDGVLKAFWGDPLNTGTNAWHMGNATAWQTATEEDLLRWTGEWYEESSIEDVLNLGINYIVNVGDNAVLGNRLTLRFTPYVSSNQDAPSYVTNPPPAAQYAGSEGIVVIDVQLNPDDSDEDTASTVEPGIDAVISRIEDAEVDDGETLIESTALISVGVADGDLNTDPGLSETVEVTLTSNHGETESLTLRESGVDTGRFVGTVSALVSNEGMQDNDGKFNLNMRTNLKAVYQDNKYGEQASPQILEASLDVDVLDDAVSDTTDTGEISVDTGSDSSSSSFDAQSDASFLLMFLSFLGLGGWMMRRELRVEAQ